MKSPFWLMRLVVGYILLALMGGSMEPAQAQTKGPVPSETPFDIKNVYVEHFKDKEVTYKTHGAARLISVFITGTDASEFMIVGRPDGGTADTLYRDGSLIPITVRFTPKTPGIKHAQLQGYYSDIEGFVQSLPPGDLAGASLKLSITQLSTQTFVTTDSITL